MRRKQRHKEKCIVFMEHRQQYYNDILFDSWRNNAIGDNSLNFKEAHLNFLLQKQRVLEDLKKQREVVDICIMTGEEPHEFVEKTAHDVPSKSWYEWVVGG
jgi:hypothetical protein